MEKRGELRWSVCGGGGGERERDRAYQIDRTCYFFLLYRLDETYTTFITPSSPQVYIWLEYSANLLPFSDTEI